MCWGLLHSYYKNNGLRAGTRTDRDRHRIHRTICTHGTLGITAGAPLLTPRDAYKGYLGSIFTGVLKNGAQWTGTCISEILSAATWLQVALLCGYRREMAMRAMHKGIHRAFVQSPHDTRATIKAVSSLSYSMPAPPCAVA